MKDINATVLVDLEPTEEKMFNNLKKNVRRGVKKAIRKGLIVEESDKWKEFYEIYKQTQKAGGATIRTLKTVLETSYLLFICKYNENIIAGLTIGFREDKYDKNIPSLSKLASLKEYHPLQPNNLLVWKAILWSKKEGYNLFDMGGWQINAKGHVVGINKFKERWGKIVYYYKNYPFHIAIGRKLVRNFKFIWWLRKKF